MNQKLGFFSSITHKFEFLSLARGFGSCYSWIWVLCSWIRMMYS